MPHMLAMLSGCLTALFTAGALAAVDANLAPPEDLVAIKGIGPGTSQKILSARPFRDWNDLIHRVPGIGPTTAGKLSAQGLTVNGRAYEDEPMPWKRFEPRPLKPLH